MELTASNIKALAMQEGGYLEWCGFSSKSKGRFFQCVIRHPYKGQTVSIRNKWLKSMESVRMDVYELRRYMVRDGFFIEFKFYIPQFLAKGMYDEDAYVNRWTKSLNSFMLGSSFIKKGDSLYEEIKNIELPQSYFRFVYPDPSKG